DRRVKCLHIPEYSFRMCPLLATLPVGDSHHVTLRAEVEDPFENGGSGHADLSPAIFWQRLEFWACFNRVNIPVFTREVELTGGGNGRCRESGRAVAESLLIDSGAGFGIETIDDAVVFAAVKIIAVNQGRDHVGAVTRYAPGHILVGCSVFLQRDIASGIQADRVDGGQAAMGVGYEH